jgi:hypothetical protein
MKIITSIDTYFHLDSAEIQKNHVDLASLSCCIHSDAAILLIAIVLSVFTEMLILIQTP